MSSPRTWLTEWGWVEAAIDLLYEAGKDTEAEAVEWFLKYQDSFDSDLLSWYNRWYGEDK